jgi:transglutaminase-like putative cysteine protease
MNLEIGRYLKPTAIIDCNNPSIQNKARDLTKGQEDINEKAKSLFYFVRDEIKYNLYVPKSLPKHFRASNILSRREGYCVQKAILLAALARATGIPSGLGFAKLRNNLLSEETSKRFSTNIIHFHGYTGLYLNEKWVKVTPTFDTRTCEKHRFVPVEWNGKNDAMFHLRNRDGELHIEYLKDFGHYYSNLPLDKLWISRIRIFGCKALEPPKRLLKRCLHI